MNVLRLERVAKLFGPFAALRDATASFEGGKLYLITGENGAGKSTLMRMIAGLSSPSRGTIERHFELSQLGYMAHATMLYDELTGMENLRFFARLYGASEQSCLEALRTVGLDPSLTRPAAQYSQGMRQRLALARAILNAPKLLLLDEPFSNLDARSAEHMVQVLAAERDAGRCILIVTHQPSLLAHVADTHLHIEGGVMRVVAPARDGVAQ
jgi:heme ABC exporter ATP-binding subunit CcmA